MIAELLAYGCEEEFAAMFAKGGGAAPAPKAPAAAKPKVPPKPKVPKAPVVKKPVAPATAKVKKAAVPKVAKPNVAKPAVAKAAKPAAGGKMYVKEIGTTSGVTAKTSPFLYSQAKSMGMTPAKTEAISQYYWAAGPGNVKDPPIPKGVTQQELESYANATNTAAWQTPLPPAKQAAVTQALTTMESNPTAALPPGVSYTDLQNYMVQLGGGM